PPGQAARKVAGRCARGDIDPAHLARAAARRTRVIARIASYAFAALLLAGVTAGAVVDALLQPRADGGAEVLFDVKRGESLRAIATRLEEHGLVRDARATTWWARLRGQAAELHAGQYWLSPAMSPGEIIDRIASGKVATWEVVIPEGLTAAEIGDR